MLSLLNPRAQLYPLPPVDYEGEHREDMGWRSASMWPSIGLCFWCFLSGKLVAEGEGKAFVPKIPSPFDRVKEGDPAAAERVSTEDVGVQTSKSVCKPQRQERVLSVRSAIRCVRDRDSVNTEVGWDV